MCLSPATPMTSLLTWHLMLMLLTGITDSSLNLGRNLEYLEEPIPGGRYTVGIQRHPNEISSKQKHHEHHHHRHHNHRNDKHHEHHGGRPPGLMWSGDPSDHPAVDQAHSPDVTAVVGRSVRLNCRIHRLGNRTVSWLRHKDVHLLTVGRYTYTSDRRFQPQHSPGSEDWGLLLDYPDVGDAGRYECQVSSTPPVSHTLKLNVLEPETHIIGGPELFIDRGSTINLTCLVINTPSPPQELTWLHHGQEVGFESSRQSGVGVWTVKGDNTTSSSVLVRDADDQDAGPYTCTPSPPAPSANVTVHVLDGSLSAPMQQSSASSAFAGCHVPTVAVILAVLNKT